MATLATTIQLATKNLTPGWVLTSSGSASGTFFGINRSDACSCRRGRALAKLQILVPGELPVAGDVPNSGKSGIATNANRRRRPSRFRPEPLGIRAVDAFYNTVSTNGVVTVSLSDIYGSLSLATSINLSAGASVNPFTVTLAVSTATFSPQVI